MPIVQIRRNSDGLVRSYNEESPWQEGSDYLWSDGNYGCDCNRSLFFSRAADEVDQDDIECGMEAYSVIITDENGATLFEDDSWSEQK